MGVGTSHTTLISLLPRLGQELGRDCAEFIGTACNIVDKAIQKCMLDMVLINEHCLIMFVDRFTNHRIGDRLMKVVKLLRHGSNLSAPVGERLEDPGVMPIARRVGAHLRDKSHRDAEIFAQVPHVNAHRCQIAGRLAQPLRKHAGDSVIALPHLITQHRHELDRTAFV